MCEYGTNNKDSLLEHFVTSHPQAQSSDSSEEEEEESDYQVSDDKE